MSYAHTAITMSTGERHHSLDNLRAIAMLAGVVFHAALAYSPLVNPVFPTADQGNAAIVDQVIWFVHLFRMPMFFVLAGFFTAMQVDRRGMGSMVRHRALRIGVPFLVFVPVMHVTMTWLTMRAATTVRRPSPVLAWLRAMQEAGPLPPYPPGTSHLWFLYYLMFFIVLLWVARTFELGRLGARIASLPSIWIIGLLPVALTLPLVAVPAPHPAPESFLPQFWALSYYGAFFAGGYLMQGHPDFMRRCTRWAPALLAGSVLLYAGFYARLMQRTPEAAFANATWPIALLEATISVWMTLACLGLSRAFLDRSHPILHGVADASYWTYIVHLPILFAIQYRLLDVDLPWPAKFAIAVVATLAACLVSYRLLVRPTPLARLFSGGGGGREKAKLANAQPPAADSLRRARRTRASVRPEGATERST
jgi:glucan biosynthesis protein C